MHTLFFNPELLVKYSSHTLVPLGLVGNGVGARAEVRNPAGGTT